MIWVYIPFKYEFLYISLFKRRQSPISILIFDQKNISVCGGHFYFLDLISVCSFYPGIF